MSENAHEATNIDVESGEPSGENASVDLGGVPLEVELDELEDEDHPLVPEVNHEYLAREVRDGVTDLELVSYAIDDPDFYALLEGEAAVGKNFCIDQLAAAANWPRVRVNMGLGTTYENLVGRYAPVDNGEEEEQTLDRAEAIQRTAQRLYERGEGQDMDKAVELASQALPDGSSFQWVDGLLTKAVKYGWWFVADEINSADESAIMPLNGVTEDRDSRYLTIEEKSEVIEPHPRFRFIATRNPPSYAGTGHMNSALESRGYIIPFDYHEDAAIAEILTERTNIVDNESESARDSLITLAQDIRQMEQHGNDFATKISTRDLIKVGRLTDIMGIRSATKTVFLGIADPTDEQGIREEIETQKF